MSVEREVREGLDSGELDLPAAVLRLAREVDQLRKPEAEADRLQRLAQQGFEQGAGGR